MRPRILDLFCGAGGAAVGYHRAGFDVVGVDIAAQPNYPFEFHQADAMTFPLDGFDAIHASPPCHDHSPLSVVSGEDGSGWMLEATVARLADQPAPWVCENVVGPSVRMAGWWFVLCGSSFGLRVRRHRRFGSSLLMLSPPCRHREQGAVVDVTGHGPMQGREYSRRVALGLPLDTIEDRHAAMGIDWMNRHELSQAIPPAYTRFIGCELIAALGVAA